MKSVALRVSGHRSTRAFRFFACVLAAPMACGSAQAQSTYGSLRGILADGQGVTATWRSPTRRR
jgi:hypothetical protein